MKKILFTLVFTLFYLPLCGFSQSDIHTPNKSEPAAFKLAKVYFLPDWSDKGMNFDGTDEKPCTEVCPQKTSYDCASGQTETYTNSCGLTCSRCVECYGCEAKGYTLTNCPANASCLNDCCNQKWKIEYCFSGYVLDGSSCRKETCSDNPNICTGGKTCISGSCQCPAGQTEVSGKCETSNCVNGGVVCSGSTGVCNETTGQCVQCMTNSDCGSGKECNANNQCIVPDACASVTCSGGKSCVDGTCVCPSNQVDNNGTCEAPNCANGGVTCSAGQTCNTTTKVCEASFRECQIGDFYYEDISCSNQYLTDKRAIGVILDPVHRLLVFPEEMNIPLSTSTTQESYLGVSDEIPPYYNATSERGYDNTKMLRDKNTMSAAEYCWRYNFPSFEEGHAYIPSAAEIHKLSIAEYRQMINNSLKIWQENSGTSSSYFTKIDLISNPLWSSDEAYAGSDPNYNGAINMWVLDSAQSNGFRYALKNATDIYVRCFARYKCVEGSSYCTITPIVIGTNPIPNQGYVKGNITCQASSLIFKETFRWNSDYSRCYLDTGDSGGSSTDPAKTPCQVGDYVYTASGVTFCSPSSSENGARIGQMLSNNYILSNNLGMAGSGSNAESQCRSHSAGGLSWELVSICTTDSRYPSAGYWLSGGSGLGRYCWGGQVYGAYSGGTNRYDVACYSASVVYRK